MAFSTAEMRRFLFTPATSKEHLSRWVQTFIGIHFPDAVVSEESNSSPMDALWTLYSKAISNDDEAFSRVMSYAARGTYKCQRKGTKLLSRTGLVNIEDVKVGDEVWSGWNFRKVTNWIHDGVKKSVRLTLEDGSEAEGSPVHRWWSWSPGGIPGWKVGAELTSDDFVMVDTTHKAFDGVEINQEEFDVGYLCGILQGDGGLSIMDSHAVVSLTGMPGPATDFWLDFCNKNGYNVYAKKQFEHSKATTYSVASKHKLVPYLKGLGLTASRSWEKSIPKIVWTSKSYMAGFVTGLFDTDGSVSKAQNSIIFALTAKRMMVELQILLRALGVNSQLHHLKLGKINKHAVSMVTITAWQLPALLSAGVRLVRGNKANEIDIAAPPKSKTVNDYLPTTLIQGLLDCLPSKGDQHKQKMLKPRGVGSYKTISRQKCLELVLYGEVNGHLSESQVEFWRNTLKNKWCRVRDVDLTGEADFYDLTVEGDHSYWSDGLVSHNTLSASVLEVALVLHTPRNIAHLAATQDQSGKAQSYCRDFFARPYLCDFRVGQNIKKIDVCRFTNEKSGIHLTEKEWQVLTDDEKSLFERKDNYIQIVTLTLQGANSAHTELLVVDEVDTVPSQNRGAYEEAKHIPDPRNGLNPITLLTSTRKFSYGLVQKEIDEAAKSGLKVFHWNAVDVAQACAPDRHHPELPKVTLYVNDSELATVSEEAYSKFDPSMREKYTKHEGFGGCASCSLFSVCKSRLATHQTSKSPLLKPIPWLRNRLKEVSTGMALTQIMCRQPDSTGLIYPKLDRALHVKTASEIAQMVTGRTCSEHMDKGTLLRILVDRGARFHSGLDFGFTHPFAVVTFAVWGQNAFVVDCISRSGLELDDKVAVCEHLRVLNPIITADTASPADIETFKRRGFQMRGAIKGQGSVKSGIEIVRMKIQPALGPPSLFFLAGDPDVEFAFQQLKMYHFVTDEAGAISDKPEEVDDDSADALRYGIVGTFAPNHKIGLPQNPNNPAPSEHQDVPGRPQWLNDYVAKLLGDGNVTAGRRVVKKGNFHFEQ